LESWPFTSNWHRFDTPFGHQFLRVWLHDPSNVDAAIDWGRLFVGDAVDLTGNLKHENGVRISTIEAGGQVESPMGHIYRPVFGRRRKVSLTLQYMTRDLALGELAQMQRVLGRSRPICVVVDALDTEYAQDFFFYGYPSINEIPHQVVDLWENTLEIEVLES
jgi:hypothetical protein